MKVPKGFVLLLIFPLMGGCIAAAEDAAYESKADKCEWTLTMEFIDGSEDVGDTGTVRFIDVEGGFWAIVADDGRKFQPTEICEDLKEDGLRVMFEGRTRPDTSGIHMWGEAIDLRLLERA